MEAKTTKMAKPNEAPPEVPKQEEVANAQAPSLVQMNKANFFQEEEEEGEE